MKETTYVEQNAMLSLKLGYRQF